MLVVWLLQLFKFGVGAVVAPCAVLVAWGCLLEIRDGLEGFDLGPGRWERRVLTGRGEDLDRAGGADMTLRRRESLVRMRCRGPCDDLMFGGGETDGARLLNHRGQVLISRRNGPFARPWRDDPQWLREMSVVIEGQAR